MSQTRPYSKQEVQEMVISTVAEIAEEYANDPDLTVLDKCHGVAFSVLAALDGTRNGMPALDLVVASTTQEVSLCQEQGEPFYENGMVVNSDRKLHTRYDQIRREATTAIAGEEMEPDDIPF